MDSSSDEEKTVKKIHGYISDEESLRIANEIDNELRTFFNQEVELDEDTNVIAVMSKGLNLFHPYLETIKKKRIVIPVKILNHTGSDSLYHRSLSHYTQIRYNIILTDAITTGSEIRKILTFSPFRYKILGGIKKVCGYMALRSTLDELKNDYPEISFSFLKVIEDQNVYNEEHKKTIYVYQKRMAPIDGEHAYSIVDINPELSLTDIKGIIQEIIPLRYGSCFELLDNSLGIETKNNFSVYFDHPEELLRTILNICLCDGDTIEKLSIRFKYSSDTATLRIMPLSMPHLDREKLFGYGQRQFCASCRRKLPKRNCKNNFSKQNIKIYLLLRFLFRFNRNTKCSECVDNNISSLLLDDLSLLLSESDLLKKS